MPDAVLHLERLRKSFGALVVTDDLTFDVMPRELHAVIGPNGAGKTTLINQISGLVAPGGQIAYMTCSVLQSENELQVESFCAGNAEWTLEQCKRISPLLGGDGFFLALLRRDP